MHLPNSLTCFGKFSTLTFSGYHRTIPYNSTNNLPIIFFVTDTTTSETSDTSIFTSLLSTSSDDLPTPDNLSTAQRKLLHIHQKFGHLHFDKMQYLARFGLLGASLWSLSTSTSPLCRACIHRKQHRHPTSSDATLIDVNHLEPGDCVSADQLESSAPGLIPTYHGTPSTSKYHAGTLFVNHASHYLHFTPHQFIGSKEALQAKCASELHASQNNRFVKPYQADNCIFASIAFCDCCRQQKQHLTFCGVNAHHQDDINECHIHSITDWACSMLIHAMVSWPDNISEQFWPIALQLAMDLHNNIPISCGLSPSEIFSGVKSTSNQLCDFHPFGCPIFVLDPSLQQGHKIPCWKPRSRVGVY